MAHEVFEWASQILYLVHIEKAKLHEEVLEKVAYDLIREPSKSKEEPGL